MAQADYIISNQTFPNTRADINSHLQAIATNNSGTSAPTTQYAGQFWIDTTSSTWTLYIHDGSDDIQFATIDTSANTVNFTDSALDVVTDTTPQLGGDLDLNSNDITGTGNINITGTGTFSGDLTVDTNTLYVDSTNNRIGIGTTSPDELLSLEKNNAPILQYKDTSGGTDAKVWRTMGLDSDYRIQTRSDDLSNGQLAYTVTRSGYVVNEHKFYTTDSERMRIDSSGNLLVGKTSAGTSTAGVEAIPQGRIGATRDANVTFLFNRLNSDGEIGRFQKDGTTVGSIASHSSGGIRVESSHSLELKSSATNGLRLDDAGIFRPQTDNVTDMGKSSNRFKDLYLSGGLYVGGTGTANKLDDYEEGSWTPVIRGGTTAGTYTSTNTSALYRKIGDQVTVQFQCFNITETSAGTGSFEISGLPFTARSDVNMRYVGTVGVDNMSYPSGSYLISSVPSGNTFVEFYENTSATGDTKLEITDISSGTSDLYFNITYFTS